MLPFVVVIVIVVVRRVRSMGREVVVQLSELSFVKSHQSVTWRRTKKEKEKRAQIRMVKHTHTPRKTIRALHC